MKIAVDAMGGDYAPGEIVKGVLEAARELDQEIILVGDEEKIVAQIGARKDDRITIAHAPEVIAMGEHPAVAVRRKKNSSIVRAVQLVKEGAADAVVSAGSTGAAMAAALLGLGRIRGIDRPAIAGILPSRRGVTVLIDVGANVDCKPHQLKQFAVMGSLYAQKILGVPSPRVGLLNVGEEETKGNELTLAAYPLLREAGLNFIGNVEGRDIFQGTADVVVCDGFVGNVVLKAGEGLAMSLMHMIREEITRSWLAKVGTAMAVPALKDFRRRVDYADYGGAPLLGVNKTVIICHGSSTSRAIKNAVRRACESVQNRLVEAIRSSIEAGADREEEWADVK